MSQRLALVAQLPALSAPAAVHASASADPRPMQPLQQRLLAHIDAQLDSPTLTPQSAAQALGVSLRRVHSLLAGTPYTFSRLVVRQRLQRAQALLAQQHASVIDVAFACGFNSLATFYRQYTAAFGASPAGRRRSAGSSPVAMTPTRPPCAR